MKQKKQRSRHHVEHLELRRLLSTIYVDAIAPGPTHNGSSWANAYTDLQSALTVATSGATIEVGQGTYKPTTSSNRTVSYQLKNGVTINGGYAGYGQSNPDARNVTLYPTILSGDIGTVGTSTDNSYHVVNGGGTNSTAIIDGFTITAGEASSTSTNGDGGGIYNSAGSPTIRNCTFTGNYAVLGGAIYNASSSAPAISSCTFTSNTDAIYNSSSSPTITNCTFSRNTNTAMSNSSSSPVVTSCLFTGNNGTSSAGAIYNSGGSPKITNCVFVDNRALSTTSYGGGIYNTSSTATIDNCTFAANSALTAGGAIYDTSSTINIGNCILWGDTAPSSGEVFNSGGSFTSTTNDIQNVSMNVNPMFVQAPSAGTDGLWGTSDDNYGNLSIKPWSPVVDAGTNSLVPSGTTTDLAGNPRFADIPTVTDTGSGTAPIVDLGAYEAVPGLLASAGGPYTVIQGQSVNLTGNGAGTVKGSLTYAWDWSGNGLFTDSTAQDPVLSTAAFSLGTHTISLKATDAANKSIIVSTTLTVLPTTLYVDQAATGANDGFSWTDAFTSLQSALGLAISGITIKVAQGTYYPTTSANRAISFELQNGVSVEGGFAGSTSSTPDARNLSTYPSVLSGDIGISGQSSDDSYHVVVGIYLNATADLDGFTITAGSAVSPVSFDSVGGGMENYHSSPTISNCIFLGNSSSSYGGGMNNDGASAPMLTNCTFQTNTSSNSGGGINNENGSSPNLINCSFYNNSAFSFAGAIYNNSTSSPTLISCNFSGNNATNGGAIANNASSSPVITNCTFTGNSATNPDQEADAGQGGAIYNVNASPTLSGCIFIRNTAVNGGAIYGGGGADPHATLTNSVFNGNSALSGGAIYNDYDFSFTFIQCAFVGNTAHWGGALTMETSSLTLINSTLAQNGASYAGGAVYGQGSATVVITNSIIWGNQATKISGIDLSGSSITVNYSDVQGGYTGTGNANVSPLFLRNPSAGADGKWGTSDDDYGNLQISAASPVADAGNNAALQSTITTDLAGNPRYQDILSTADTGSGTAPIVDMGAYEAAPALVAGIGGPYTVLQGQTLTVYGYGASTNAGAFQYAWDFTNSGLFRDATGPQAQFPVGSFAPGSTVPIALEVTDAVGNSATSASTVFIAPTVLYVDAAATGANDGVDWTDAYTSLATAISAALPGESLHVAGGTYYPAATTDRTVSFDLKSGVAIYGGYAGAADPAAPDTRNVAEYPTVLSGNIGSSSSSADNSYHVVFAFDADSTAVLDGVTVTVGNASGSASSNNGRGGAVFISGGTPVFNNCIFTSSTASTIGSAANIVDSGAFFDDCTFANNSNGDIVYLQDCSSTFQSCSFNGNAGIALDNESDACAVIDSSFVDNTGSGIFSDSTMTITGCFFEGNNSSINGGGINTEDGALTITGCTFIANSTAGEGGAIHLFYSNSVVANCVFVGNSAKEGGAIEADDGLAPTITDCTFADNSAIKGGALYSAVNTTIANCIFWGDSATTGAEFYKSGGTPTITYSDIQGGYTSTGNINLNPQFIRAPGTNGASDYGDLHLQFTSPCIDTGSNAAIPSGITTDLDGNPRIFDLPGAHDPGAIVDMGAYELGTNLDAINVPAGQTLSLPGSGYAFTVNQLTIGTGGTLNLGSDTLAIEYAAGSDPVSSIASLLSSAFANGQWTGTGITSSLASTDTTATTATTGVGYFDNGSQIVIGDTWYGDANLDGQINGDDLSLMLLGQTQNKTRWQDGDFTYHNQINADDWIKFAYALAYSNGQSLPGFSSGAAILSSYSSATMTASSVKSVLPPFAQAPITSDEYLADLLSSPSVL